MAPRDDNELIRELREQLEPLREPLAQAAALLDRMDGQPTSPADRVNRHVRRYLPLYALGTIWALMLILIPTVNDSGGGEVSRLAGAPGTDTGGDFGEFGDTGTDDGAGVDFSDGGSTSSGGTNAGGSSGGISVPGGGSTPPVKVGTGTTRGGFACKQGVRQMPWSTYATPCVAAFNGANGGKTYRGVDEKTIKVIVRATSDAGGPNAQAVDEINKAAGMATRTEALEILKQYVNYLNGVYELYGRKIVLEEWGSNVSNGTDEAQSKGREAACADATAIKNMNAFAVLTFSSSFINSEPFTDCLAKEKIVSPLGAAYFPENWYSKRWHPYAWNTIMECERIATDVGEYVGKRLAGKNAKWAGDPVYQKTKRVFGVYVPDNDGYQRCVDIYDNIAERNGFKTKSRVNYVLDVARFADQAALAVTQFQRDGVTTLVNACDTYSTIFLMQAADQQQWNPEWLLIGVAAQDTDGFGRLFDESSQADGHLFGMSQLGSNEKIFGKKGEAYATWKKFKNTEPPRGFGTIYFAAVHLFNLFQASGPILTPQNISAGVRSLPPGGGASGAFGTWSLRDDHTQIDDSREIYWSSTAKGFDGGTGTYLETYNGKRFKSGGWPREDPPIYPKK